MTTTRIIHHLDHVVRRIDAEMHRRVPPFDEDRVGPLGSLILTHLARIAPAPAQRLVEQMGRDASQMTRLINRLENKGMLVRSVSTEDRRVRQLDLTEKGRLHVGRLDAIMSEIIDEIMEPLTHCEKELFDRLLSRINETELEKPAKVPVPS
ncbi:MAG: MarR family transcriptional regulator [Pseudomonadota bacterium]